MSKTGRAVSILSPEDASSIYENFTAVSVPAKRPGGNYPLPSVMVERRRKIARAKFLLYKEERRAIRSDKTGYLKGVMLKWDSVPTEIQVSKVYRKKQQRRSVDF